MTLSCIRGLRGSDESLCRISVMDETPRQQLLIKISKVQNKNYLIPARMHNMHNVYNTTSATTSTLWPSLFTQSNINTELMITFTIKNYSVRFLGEQLGVGRDTRRGKRLEGSKKLGVL